MVINTAPVRPESACRRAQYLVQLPIRQCMVEPARSRLAQHFPQTSQKACLRRRAAKRRKTLSYKNRSTMHRGKRYVSSHSERRNSRLQAVATLIVLPPTFLDSYDCPERGRDTHSWQLVVTRRTYAGSAERALGASSYLSSGCQHLAYLGCAQGANFDSNQADQHSRQRRCARQLSF
jgi:hypothetical protein